MRLRGAAVSGSDDKPAVIRLELRVSGLNCRPRLAFTGPDITPLWLLVDGAQLLINIDPPVDRQALPFALVGTGRCTRNRCAGPSAHPDRGASSARAAAVSASTRISREQTQ